MINKISISFFILLCFFSKQSYSQSYNTTYLSYEYIEIISFSIKITYSNSDKYYNSQSSLGFYSDALSARQAKHDRNHDIISIEYGKLIDFKLINLCNNSTLTNYKNKRLNKIKTGAAKSDLSKQANADYYLKLCTDIYNYQYVKSEIKLLRKCYTDLRNLRSNHPNTYKKTGQYKSISRMLDYLKNCSKGEISSLYWTNFTTDKYYKQKYTNPCPVKKASPITYTKIIFRLSNGGRYSIINVIDNTSIGMISKGEQISVKAAENDTYIFDLYYVGGRKRTYKLSYLYRFKVAVKKGVKIVYLGKNGWSE